MTKMIWTKEKTWKSFHHSESSFIHTKQGFENNPHRGLSYLKQKIIPSLGGGECYIDSEVIFQKNKKLDDFENKNILIIGSGPSLNEFDFSMCDQYDKIIACNHYFLREEITNLNLSIVFLGDEVRYKNDLLHNHLQRSDCLIGFENIGRNESELVSFKKDYKDRVFWAHTRYHSKIGAVVRFAAFACSLNPKKISFIGMDGFKKEESYKEENVNFLRPGKSNHGSLETKYNLEQLEVKYKEQYLVFWDYILHDAGRNIKFENLGHGHPCNLTTEILSERLGEGYQSYLLNPEERK